MTIKQFMIDHQQCSEDELYTSFCTTYHDQLVADKDALIHELQATVPYSYKKITLVRRLNNATFTAARDANTQTDTQTDRQTREERMLQSLRDHMRYKYQQWYEQCGDSIYH